MRQWIVTPICSGLGGACLGDAWVGLGKDHLNHVQGDREEGPLLVHLLQLAQVAGVYDGLSCAAQPLVTHAHSQAPACSTGLPCFWHHAEQACQKYETLF